MNIVADESVDRQIVQQLRGDGHDVLSIAESDPGVDDEVVLAKSRDADQKTTLNFVSFTPDEYCRKTNERQMIPAQRF